MAMQIIRHLVAMTAAVLLATTSGAPAADADPPLPLAVKQRLTELTEAPSARGQCFDAEAVAAVAGAAPAYADEIALFAGRRVQDRAPRGADDCSCLIELATALGRAVPARAQTLARLIAQPSAACGRLIVRRSTRPRAATARQRAIPAPPTTARRARMPAPRRGPAQRRCCGRKGM